jgi:hypothetical protein
MFGNTLCLRALLVCKDVEQLVGRIRNVKLRVALNNYYNEI